MIIEATRKNNFIHPYTFSILKDDEQKQINGEYKNELIKSFNAQPKKIRQQIMSGLAAFIEDKFDIESNTLNHFKRSRKKTYPRHLFGYCLRTFYKCTCIEIGEFMKRDHSTIINSSKVMDGFLTYDRQVINDVGVVESFMKNDFDYIINYKKNEDLP